MDQSRHAGKIALVTGAAQGMGQEFALRLASEGAEVVLADLADTAETERRLRPLWRGRSALAVKSDLTVPEEVARLAEMIRERFGRCDIVVNNAGIYPRHIFDEMTFDDWRRVMSLNLDAPFLVTKAILPLMRERDPARLPWGRIINIASNVGLLPRTHMAHYAASKMGLIGLTRALATELGASGITANAVAPGLVRTDTTDALGEDIFERVASQQPITRTTLPGDIAGVVSFLASEEAAMITGQTIVVDGGLARV